MHCELGAHRVRLGVQNGKSVQMVAGHLVRNQNVGLKRGQPVDLLGENAQAMPPLVGRACATRV